MWFVNFDRHKEQVLKKNRGKYIPEVDRQMETTLEVFVQPDREIQLSEQAKGFSWMCSGKVQGELISG